MSILVTGGAGFIGSHLVEALISAGEEVTILDNFSAGSHNLRLLEKLHGVTVIKGELSDDRLVDKLVSQNSMIYHLAAMNRAPRSIENPILSNEVNITGTLKILEAARKYEVKGFVFASSSSVYGLSEVFPRKEDGETFPAHPYAVGKLASEYYCKVYHKLFGLNVKILRYFAVYGPRQSPTLKYSAVIPIFIKNVINGKPVTIFGDGTQSRNFTYVNDNVKATIAAMKSDDVSGRIINIASPWEVTLNDIISVLEKKLDQIIEVRYEDWRQGDIKRSIPDLSLASKLLGVIPTTKIEEGLKIVFEWCKANPKFFDNSG